MDVNNQDVVPPSPGDILRRCRESYDISLDEAAAATKIGVNYLDALENDQIEAFASLAYLKGFLRMYATHLGLDADDMIRLYETLHVSANRVDGQGVKAGGDASGNNKKTLQKLALPLVLALLLIIAGAIYNRSGTQLQRRVLVEPVAMPIIAAAVQPVRSTARQVFEVQKKSAGTDAVESMTVVPAGFEQSNVQKNATELSKSFIVRMKVTHNGLLTVTIDGVNPQNYDLVSGDSVEWKAEKTVALELSNAGGVEVEVNGKLLKTIGTLGSAAYVVLDVDGIKK